MAAPSAAVSVTVAAVAAAAAVVSLVCPHAAHAAPTVPMVQHLVNASVCLDGSPAGYYYAPPPSVGGTSDAWLVYLQGGGACYTQETCAARAATPLGTSTQWPSSYTTTAPNAAVSDDPALNPDFAGAHHVYVPYCTGDVHVGARNMTQPMWGYAFNGHANLGAFLDDILADATMGPALKAAKHLLLTGSSAGGMGTFHNADYFAARLPWIENLRASPVAGWFFPGDAEDLPQAPWQPPSAWPNWSLGEAGGKPLGIRNGSISALWMSDMNPACTAAQKPGEAFRCNSVHVLYPHIKTPLFVQQNLYDSNQLLAQLMLPSSVAGPNVTEDELDYVRYYGRAARNSTNQLPSTVTALAAAASARMRGGGATGPGTGKPAGTDGIFLASCLQHVSGLGVNGGTTGMGPAGLQLNTTVMLGDWFFGRGDVPHEYRDTCETATDAELPCNPSCLNVQPTPCATMLEATCGDSVPNHGSGSRAQCEQCAEAHRGELAKAGCTVASVQALCS